MVSVCRSREKKFFEVDLPPLLDVQTWYHGEVRLRVALFHRFEKKMLIRAVNVAAQ